MSASPTLSLPVIDCAGLRESSPLRHATLDKLNEAAREIGFFYLINHGIEQGLLDDVQRVAHQFFALPEQEKWQVRMENSPHFRGYNVAGSEITRNAPDYREQFDIGADRPLLPVDPALPWQRLQGPNQWPDALPELKVVITRWQQQMNQVALTLLRAFAESLQLPATAFDPLYGELPNEHVKLIRYPGQPTEGTRQGVGSHKDSGFLSFLLQDKQRGLQVEVQPNRWVDALPLPGSLVVNIGELLELATNGYLRATVHRVLSPPPGTERLSIAFFLGADLSATVPVYPLPPELAQLAHGPASDPLNPLLRDVGFNYLKGRLRSHPDVARRFYADL